MLKNYFLTTIRNLWKRKSFTLINIFGLAAGMAVSFLILLYVIHETSYDRFHEYSHSIYRIATIVEAQGRKLDIPSVPGPLGPAMKAQFPEVIEAARIRGGGRRYVKVEENSFQDLMYYADPGLFKVFTISVVLGDADSMLETPFSMVLTEDTARKYFGGEDPIGRHLKIDNRYDYTITGVVRSMPTNSHFRFDMLSSLSTLEDIQRDLEMWMGFNYITYFRVAESASLPGLLDKTQKMLMDNQPPQFAALGAKIDLFFQPLRDIHLHSHLEGELSPPGNPAYIRILITIALFILAIACINFMNLSTALSAHRAKEVGMRKVLGAGRRRLVGQFLGESILLSLLSLVLAVILIQFLLPIFNNLTAQELRFLPMANVFFLLVFVGIALAAGLVAGAYPALFLSSFAPIDTLKSRFRAGKGHAFFRNGLVSVQYIISIALISCTLVIFSQLHMVRNYDLGFDKEQVATIRLRGEIARKSLVFKNEVLKLPGVVKASLSNNVPGSGNNETMFSFEGVEPKKQVHVYNDVDSDYLETMGMELASGRNFSSEPGADTRSVILNKTLAGQLGWADPVGKTIQMTDLNEAREFIEVPYTVIGVVKDFHFDSLHQKLRGSLLLKKEESGTLSVKLQTQNTAGTLKAIEGIWKSLESTQPFSYTFLDDTFEQLYRTEMRMGRIFVGFTSLAILISCLGLFGLASFASEQRTKEIGIRKVLGASASQVIMLLTRDFTKWVLLANLIAWPISWWAMRKWLENFAYRIDLGIWIFAAAGVAAFFVAVLTISTRTLRAASANPADSLRYE